jgi:hypothetical protein
MAAGAQRSDPERGTVRLEGGPAPAQLRVSVWDGLRWLPIRGVTGLVFDADANRLPCLQLWIDGPLLEVLVGADNMGFEVLRETARTR